MLKTSLTRFPLLIMAAVLLTAFSNRTHGMSGFPDPTYFVGAGPGLGMAGDFNGDGRPDVLMANFGSRDISCLLSRGNGTFAPEVRSSFGGPIYGMTIGDFNRDGRMDLAVVSTPVNPGSVLLGMGDGTFGALLPLGVGGESVAAGDFNADGKTDLVVSSEIQSVVLLGAGDGTFGAPRDVGVAGRTVAVADVDADGRDDLIITTNSDGDVAVLLGRGDGMFGSPIRSGSQLGGAFVLGDFDNDRHLDLVVGDPYSQEIKVLLGAGDGSFTPLAPIPAGGYPRAMAAGDFNRDGREDLAVTAVVPDATSVYLGNGQGGFSPARPVSAPGAATALLAMDFDSDGVLDLLIVSGALDDVSFFPGAGDGSFGHPLTVPAGRFPLSVAFGDFNADGSADLAVSSGVVLLGMGGSRFADPLSLGVRGAVAVGDFNADGKQDLALARFGDGLTDPGDIEILIGHGDGTFVTPRQFPAGTHPVDLGIADFDSDGNLDVAVANWDSADISVLLGRGDGTLSPALSTPAGIRPNHLAVGDFNADGRPDLAQTFDGPFDFEPTGGLGVFIGQGDGRFKAAAYDAGLAPRGVAVADFNGDGREDLATADPFTERVWILRGLGDGTFAAATQVQAGAVPIFVAARDFDADGLQDLVTLDGGNEVIFVPGMGDGTFAPERHFLAGLSAITLAAGDVDGDGWIDLVVPHRFNDDAWILLNQNGTHDRDGDGVPDAGDNCPTIPNADQDPEACDQRIVDIIVEFGTSIGKGSGVVSWRTTHEVNLIAFNIVTIDSAGRRSQLNLAPVPCEECITGIGVDYSFTVPKHRSGKNIFIEPLCSGDCPGPFGPAVRR